MLRRSTSRALKPRRTRIFRNFAPARTFRSGRVMETRILLPREIIVENYINVGFIEACGGEDFFANGRPQLRTVLEIPPLRKFPAARLLTFRKVPQGTAARAK